MKIRNLLLAALIALSTMGIAGSANAASIISFGNDLSTDHSLGPVNANDVGIIQNATGKVGGQTVLGYVSGLLAAHTQVVFTYSFDALPSGLLTATTPSPSPLITIGGVQPTFGLGNTIITNLSNTAANFSTYFLPNPGNSSNVFLQFYAAASVVPLPAALPLFALGLAGLAGYSRKKKASA